MVSRGCTVADAYLYEQSGAIGKMNMVMQQLDAENSLLFRQDDKDRERESALKVFLHAWQQRQKRIERKKRRNSPKPKRAPRKKQGKGKGLVQKLIMEQLSDQSR